MTATDATATTASDYLANGIDTIPGWFQRRDAGMMLLAHEAQRECGVRGNILEIGVFFGRCAILLGYLQGDGERLVVADIFDADEQSDQSKRWRPKGVEKPQRDAFVANYRRFHADLPEIFTGPSSALDVAALGPHSFRLIHIDGAHDWENVQIDIGLAEALASDDAILVFDDVGTITQPAVAARVWSEVLSGRLHPIAVTGKLYTATNPESPVVKAFRARIQAAADFRTESHRIGDADVMVVAYTGAEHAPPRIAPRSPVATPWWKRVVQEVAPPVAYRTARRAASAVRSRGQHRRPSSSSKG